MSEGLLEKGLLVAQLAIYLLGRLLDDMSWYDVGVHNQLNVFEGIGVAGMTICVILQIIRKWNVDGMVKILFIRSQLKFLISWALVITICFLFFNIFGCQHELPESELVYFFVAFDGCCINITQIILTNFNCSLICNTKAHKAELILYETILFGEIIYNGNLLMLFINNLEDKPKDYSILLISIIIANQILIMDLIFRAAYEDRERQQEKEDKMIGHHVGNIMKIFTPEIQGGSSLPELVSTTKIEMISPTKNSGN